MSIPESLRARRKNSPLFFASRTALVATATMSAFNDCATSCMRCKHVMPRSIASAESSFISPAPWPMRTFSFSRAMTSKPWSTILATTIWKLLVPISRAAMVSLFIADAILRAYFEASVVIRLLSLQVDVALRCVVSRALSTHPTRRGRCVQRGRTQDMVQSRGRWRISNGRGQRLHHQRGRTPQEENSCSCLRSSTR